MTFLTDVCACTRGGTAEKVKGRWGERSGGGGAPGRLRQQTLEGGLGQRRRRLPQHALSRRSEAAVYRVHVAQLRRMRRRS